MHITIRQTALGALSLSLGISAFPTTVRDIRPALPVVDLGYELHQALTYNETSQVYKFQNIRYAQPPVGNLRFRAPVSPKKNRAVIQIGNETRTCPQGVPSWQGAVSGAMTRFYDPAVSFSLDIWEEALRNALPPNVNFNAASSEDCLFLDVHVSKKVLDSAKSKKPKGKKGAPVLVWIHGGGYTLGSKSGSPAPSFNPRGLMWHAGLGGSKDTDDMIFVALNYRLGAPGFLSSPEVFRNGDLNAGILDQRLALDWVQSNIHLFGGAKSRVTVMGQSAGGGSILIHMSAHGGRRGPAPFSAAIPQSPAFMPTLSQPSTAYPDFLRLLNVTSLSEARKLSSDAIIRANEAQIFAAPAVNYIYGPVIDNDYIPAPVSTLLRSGKFDTSVTVLASHNSFEGAIFYDPTTTTDAQFRPFVERSFPGLPTKHVSHVVNTLYPPVYDNPAIGYSDVESRQMAVWSEAVIDCNFNLIGDVLSSTRGGKSYAYEFDVRPGFHIQDTKYSFNDPTSPAVFPKTQDMIQEMIVGFVGSGVPRLNDGTRVPAWGRERRLVRFDGTGAGVGRSEVNGTRCEWWSGFQGGKY